MAQDILQAEYETLEEIASRFAHAAEANLEHQNRLRQIFSQLEQGGWRGRGAESFFHEMNDQIFPALNRLVAGLSEGSTTVQQISALLAAAEEEAANQFAPGAGAPDPGAGSGADQMPPAPPPLPSSQYVVKNPNAIFDKAYMNQFIGIQFQGANSPELNRLMEELLRKTRANESDVGGLLNRIADIRGVDRAAFQQQYQTFQNLWRNAVDKGTIDLTRHGNYMGSTVSLRYGAVVGEVFGIDPVFGAVLNPTGGLVGPGSDAYQPGRNDAIGYHGVFHDAAGYLYNNHGQLGPGYDYLGRDYLATSNPLSGQVGGISWWAARPQLTIDFKSQPMPDIPYVPQFMEPVVWDILQEDVLPAVRPWTYVAEGGAAVVDGIRSVF